MSYLKKNILFKTGWAAIFLAGLCWAVPAQANTDPESSCVACHTHYGNMKNNLSKAALEISPLIEGMG